MKRIISLFLAIAIIISVMPHVELLVFAEEKKGITEELQELRTSENCGEDHIWDEGVVDTTANCTTSGVILYTCTLCSTQKREETPATGHVFQYGLSTSGKHNVTCENCNYRAVEDCTPRNGRCLVCCYNLSGDNFTYEVEGDHCVLTGMVFEGDDYAFFGVEYNGRYYGLSTTETTWIEAKTACESYGGTLVTIEDEKEAFQVRRLIPVYETFTAWIGAYVSEDGWQWITGEETSYEDWGYPDDFFGDYACIFGATGAWNRDDETATKPYICEFDTLPEEGVFYLLPEKISIPYEIDGLIVEGIADGAFENCGYIRSLSIPNYVTHIGMSAFYGCISLREVKGGTSVREISHRAFGYCSSLEEITLHRDLESLDYGVFEGCENLNTVTVLSDDCYFGTMTEAFGPNDPKIIAPQDSTALAYAERCGFEWELYIDCDDGYHHYAKTVITASTCTTTGKWKGTCKECNRSTTETSPMKGHNFVNQKCTSCGQAQILSGSCGTKAKYTLDLGTGTLRITGSGAMTNYPTYSNDIPWYAHRPFIREIRISEGITSVGSHAFSNLYAVKNLTIPSSVTTIGMWAFSNTGLTSVVIPDTVLVLGTYAFLNCTSLKKATLPAGVTEIPEGLLQGCDNLISVEIPSGVRVIGGSAFSYCYNLSGISLPEGLERIGDYAFASSALTYGLILPDSLVELGEGALSGVFLEELRIPENLSTIGMYCFFGSGIGRFVVDEDNAHFTADERGVLFSKDMTTLIAYPSYCYETEYVVPEGVNYISDGAFMYSSLQKVVLPSTLSMIGMDAFSYSWNLAEVEIPYGVSDIMMGAFSNCSSLRSIKIPGSVYGIGSHAFYNCTALEEVIIEPGVWYIDDYAFGYCSSLESLTIPGTVEYLYYSPIAYCDNLSELILEDGIQYFYGNFLTGCSNVTELTVPASVMEISADAFASDNLESLTILNPDCILPDDYYSLGTPGKTVLHGYAGSTTQAHAEAKGYEFVPLMDCATGYHSYVETVEQELGCLQDGVSLYACEGCGDSYQETTPQLGHSYGEDHLCIRCEEHETVSGSCGELITWEIDLAINHLTISGTGQLPNFTGSGDSAAPWKEYSSIVKTISITQGISRIGNRSFINFTALLSVALSEGVESIGDSAFMGCTSLTSISLPMSLTTIAVSSFEKCSSLKSVVIPDGVTNIGSRAFAYCTSLVNINIPQKITSLPDYLFWNCNSITNVAIPESVSQMGYGVFRGCSRITTATIPDSVTEMGRYVFQDCTSLVNVQLSNKLTVIELGLFTGCSSLTSINIPDGVEIICSYAFSGCTNLTSVYIPNSVEIIRTAVFEDCKSLTSILLPDTITTIEGTTFSGCSGLKEITLPSKLTIIDGNMFCDCSALTTVVIPKSIKSIKSYAFKNCAGITSIVIPSNVTNIGTRVFEGCTSLNKISIVNPSCIIDANINSLGLPGYTTIYGLKDSTAQAYADTNGYGFLIYMDCDNGYHDYQLCIEKVATCTLGGLNRFTCVGCQDSYTESVAKLGHSYGEDHLCIRCEDHEFASGTCGEAVLWEMDLVTGELILSGSGPMFDYTAPYGNKPTPWNDYGELLTTVTMNDAITTLGSYAFYECGALTQINLSRNITSIGQNAFMNCSGLTSIQLPENVTDIAAGAFSRCTGLTSIHIPNSVTTICGNTFSGCSGLTSVTLPEGLKTIEFGAFQSCSGLTSITIPQSVTKIGQYAFRYCRGLTSFVIPDGVTSISENLLSDCTALTSVTIPDTVTSIGSGAFKDCSSLTSIDLPQNIKYIFPSTFAGCSGLTSITIPDKVIEIFSSAFHSCTGLTEIHFGSGELRIGVDVFLGCTGLTSVVLPENVIGIGYRAFALCSSLTELCVLNPNCEIEETATNSMGVPGVTVLYGFEGSTAEIYAASHGFEFAIYINCEEGYHNYLSSVVEEPLCLTQGCREYRCTACNDAYEEPIAALGHSRVTDFSKEPTCTEPGLTAGAHCGRCSKILTPQKEISALGHSYKYENPDSENHRRTCRACDYSDTQAHTWDSGKVSLTPTCLDAGIRVYTCSLCKFSRDENIDALGHLVQQYTQIDPTCTEDGKTVGSCCTRCNEILSGLENIPAKGHSYVSEVIAPTYLFEGYTLHTCSVCADSYKTDITEPLPRTSIEEAELTLEFTSAYYEGKAVRPAVFIRYNGEELDPSKELRLSYSDNNKVGTATVYVTGINRFIGTRTLTFVLSYEVIPEAIINVTAVGEIGKISLSWSISAEVDTDTYRIYRKSEKDTAFTLLRTINDRNTLSYTDTQVERDVYYTYYVTGVGLYGAESQPSVSVTAASAIDKEKPVVTKVLPDSSDRIRATVSFGANATDNVGVKTLRLEYSQDQMTWTEIGTCAYGKKLALNTEGLEDGIVYIRVYAIDEEGNESAPLRRAYYVDNTAPSQVQGLDTLVIYSSRLTLTWEDVEDVDRRYFVVQMEKENQWTTLATVDKIGYNASGLKPDTEYSFRVAAKDQCGNVGSWSQVLTVRTPADTTAPTITGHSPKYGRVKDSLSFKVTASDECGIYAIEIFASVDLKEWTSLSKKTFTSTASSQSYTYSVPLSRYPEGEIYLCGVAYDYSGNESSAPGNAVTSSYYIDRTAPSAPKGVKATGNNGYITVEWQDITEEDRGTFTVYRATSESGPYNTVASNYSYRSYHDRTVKPDVVYYYKVAVSDQCGNVSSPSEIVWTTMAMDTEKPEIISFSQTYQQRVSKSYNEITVLASDNSRLERLIAEYKIGDQADYVALGSATGINDYSRKLSLKLPVNGLADGTVITVRAYAIDASGLVSEYRTETYTVDCSAPTVQKLSATLSGNSVKLTWKDERESDISGFRIYRSTNGGSYTNISSHSYKTAGSYSYTDTISGEEAATFRYRITAIDSLGNSADFYTELLEYTPVFVDQPPVANVSVPKVMEVGVEQYLDATASTDDGVIVSYRWDFGDGTYSNLPKTVKRYSTAGEYTITLTLTDDNGLVTVNTYMVLVKERSLLGTLNIQVVDGNRRALAGAMVCIDKGTDRELTVYTDAKGIATVRLETGEHDIAAFLDQHHIPARKTASVLSNTARDISLTLVEEEIVTGDFEIERMDLDEIKAAGIDIYDEANHNIYKVSVRVTYSNKDYNITYTRDDSKVLTYVIYDSNGNAVEKVKDSAGNDRVLTPIVVPSSGGDIVAILDVPVQAQFLKEFFDVKLHITNHSPEEFVLIDNTVTLNVPEGMTLMKNLNGFLSSEICEFSSLKGQETMVLRWCLRGDVEGDYFLSADYFGVMDYFNRPISATFESKEPVKVYGMGGVGLNLLFANQDSDGMLYFSVGLENKRDVDLYMPGIKVEGMLTDVTAVAELRNDEDRDFGIPTLINIYLEDGEDRKSLPAIYDVNGELVPVIDTLKPGQNLIYEYMCYCSVADGNHAYFKEAAVSVFSGISSNVHVGTYERQGISLQNYSAKIDRLLSRDEEAKQFREAYEYIARDKNYYYYYQGTDLCANLFEELYQIVDGILTFDVGNFTNEDKENLVEAYLYDAIMRVADPAAEQVMYKNVEGLIYALTKEVKPLIIADFGTALEGKNLDSILKIAAEDLSVLVNVLNNKGYEAFLSKFADIIQGRMVTLGVNVAVIEIFKKLSLDADKFAYVAPALQEVYGLIAAGNQAVNAYEKKQLFYSAMRASASFEAQEGVINSLLEFIDGYSGSNKEVIRIVEDILEDILRVLKEEKSGQNWDWLHSLQAGAGEFAEGAISTTIKAGLSYLAKVKDVAWAGHMNKITLGWKIADKVFNLGEKALQQGAMDAYVGIGTVLLGTFKDLVEGERSQETDLSAYYILSMLTDMRLLAERDYKGGVCSYMQGGILPRTEAKALEVINGVNDTDYATVDHWFDDVRDDIVWSKWILFNMDIPIAPNGVTVTPSTNADSCGFVVYNRVGHTPMEGVDVEISKFDLITEERLEPVYKKTDEFGACEIPADGGTYIVKLTMEDFVTKEFTIIATPGQISTLFMSPDADTPTVFSVMYTEADDTNSVDLLSQKIILFEDDDTIFNLTVYGDYNGTVKEYILIQGGKVIQRNSTGIFKGLTAKSFSFEKDICAAVIGEDDVTGEYMQVNLLVKESFKPDEDDFCITFTDEIQCQLPSEIPIIGGLEIKLDLSDIPIFAEIKEDTIKVGVNLVKLEEDGSISTGINYGKSDEDGDGEKDGFWNAFKKSVKEKTDPREALKELKKTKLKMLETGKSVKIGKDKLEFEVWGYMEGNTETGEVSGEIAIMLNASKATHFQLSLAGIPITASFEIHGKLDASLKASLNMLTWSDLNFVGTINPTVGLSVGVGPGFANVASLTINGGGDLGFGYSYNSDVGDYYNLWLKAYMYVKLKVLFAEFNADIMEKTWTLLEKTVPKKGLDGFTSDDLMDLSNYSLASREYLEEMGQWTEGVGKRSDSMVLLQKSVYDDTRLKIVEANGKKIMFFLTDDPERNDLDCSMLVYSVYDDQKGTWSQPVAVENDGTADFTPIAVSDGENVYVVWSDLKPEANEEMSFADISGMLEMKYAKMNVRAGTIEVHAITDDSYADLVPQATVIDGELYVLWTKNRSNNLLGNDNSNALYLYTTDTKETQCVKENISNVIETTVGTVGDQVVYSYISDKDGDYSTVEDRELVHSYVEDADRTVSVAASAVSGLRTFRGNPAWVEDGTLRILADSGEAETFFQKGTIGGNYKLYETEDKVYLLSISTVTAENGDVGAELFAYVYDKTLGLWGEAVQLTALGKTIKDYEAFVSGNGQLRIVVTASDIVRGEETVTETTSIYTVKSKTTADYVLTDLDYDAEIPVEEGFKIPFTATLKNQSVTNGGAYKLSLHKDGEEIAFLSVDKGLQAGEVCEISGEFVIPEITEEKEQLVVYVCNRITGEAYSTVGEIVVGKEQVNVIYTGHGISDAFSVINTTVENNGTFAENLVFEVRADGLEGELLQTHLLTVNAHSKNPVVTEVDATKLTFENAAMNIYLVIRSADSYEILSWTYFVVYPPHEHTVTELPAVEGSCTVDAKTAGTWCAICGTVFAAQEITPAPGHVCDAWELTKEGNCSEDGEETGTCTACGEILTRPVKGTGHEAGEWRVSVEAVPGKDGVKELCCKHCEEVMETEPVPMLPIPKLKSASLTLQDDLVVNFKISKEFLTSNGYSDPYVVCSFNGEKTVIREYTVSGDLLSFDFPNIIPHQMDDTISATLYITYDGEEYASEELKYSASTYCYNMLGKLDPAVYGTLCRLLVDLLNYGAASQQYMNYKTDELVNARLTEVQKALGTTVDRSLTTVQNVAYKTIANPTVQWKSAGLNLQKSVGMRFKIAADSIEGLRVKVESDVGNWFIPAEEFEETTGGWYVYVKGMNAGQMSEPVYVTVYKGNTVVSNTLSYSIESYAYSKQNNTDVKLAELVKAMMRYGDSAKAFLGN